MERSYQTLCTQVLYEPWVRRGNYLLKEWTFKKPEDELIYQAEHDDLTGRIWAVNELHGFRESHKTMDAWCEIAVNDRFWAVRKAGIEQLGKLNNSQFKYYFHNALNDTNSKVRAAALVALANSGEEDIVALCRKIFKTDEGYLVMAEALTLIGTHGDRSQLKFLEEAGKMRSPRNVVGRAAGKASEMIRKRK